MGIKFCCSFNTSTSSVIPGVSPSVEDNVAIDTAVKKFGAGSLHSSNENLSSRVKWSGADYLPSDPGCINFWYKRDSVTFYVNNYITGTGGGKNDIELSVAGVFSGRCYIRLIMYDSTGSIVINTTWYFSQNDYDWHHCEVAWDWSVSGITYMFNDGTLLWSSGAAAGKTRLGGSSTPTIEMWLSKFDPVNSTQHLDDFTVWDEVLHDKDFTPPNEASCFSARYANLGYPFAGGFARGFGR